MDKSILNNKIKLAAAYEIYTTCEIGEKIGLHNEYVRKALHRHKIPVRGKGARTPQDKIDRAIVRIKNDLRQYPVEQRQEIIFGLSV